MNMLNDDAMASVEKLDSGDSAYCLKLAQRLGAMGLSKSLVFSAVKNLADADAVPSFIPAAAVPSLIFGGKAAAGKTAAAFEEQVAVA